MIGDVVRHYVCGHSTWGSHFPVYFPIPPETSLERLAPVSSSDRHEIKLHHVLDGSVPVLVMAPSSLPSANAVFPTAPCFLRSCKRSDVHALEVVGRVVRWIGLALKRIWLWRLTRVSDEAGENVGKLVFGPPSSGSGGGTPYFIHFITHQTLLHCTGT